METGLILGWDQWPDGRRMVAKAVATAREDMDMATDTDTDMATDTGTEAHRKRLCMLHSAASRAQLGLCLSIWSHQRSDPIWGLAG